MIFSYKYFYEPYISIENLEGGNMRININKLLYAASFAIDFIEMDILKNVTNHSKRVAVISNKIALGLNFSEQDRFDLITYALLHDNGVAEYKLDLDKRPEGYEGSGRHCIIGENNLIGFPFQSKHENVLLYHHEYYNGSGYFGKSKDDIPIFSQIICLADTVEKLLNQGLSKEEVLNYFLENKNILFSEKLVLIFEKLSAKPSFWLDLNNIFLNNVIKNTFPVFYIETDFYKMRDITKVLSKIVDSKSSFTSKHSSGLSEKTKKMAQYYQFDKEKIQKLIIAADLHDIGKLAIPNVILDKSSHLSNDEFLKIKEHTYYTRIILEQMDYFEEITEWASNHHEKLNGRGYPYGLTDGQLDFESRLLGCLDIYQALTEDRPYRNSLPHEEAMKILRKMADNYEIDSTIVEDMNIIFERGF